MSSSHVSCRFLVPQYPAVRYHRSDSYLPDYLVRGTLEFGLNFLTFQAVEANTLDALASCLMHPWSASSEGQGEEDEEDEVSSSAVTLSADLLSSIGHRSLLEEPTEFSSATECRYRALNRMLCNCSSAAEADVSQDTEAKGAGTASGTQASSSQAANTRKRKRKGASSAGSCPVKKKGPPKTPETVASDEGETRSGCFQTNKQVLYIIEGEQHRFFEYLITQKTAKRPNVYSLQQQ